MMSHMWQPSGSDQKTMSHANGWWIYVVLENLALLALGKVLQQLLVRYHVGEPICESWVRKPTFLLFEFKIRVHREV